MEIAVRTGLSNNVDSADEIRSVLDSALRHETEFAAARRDYFARACRDFERRFNLSSEQFMQQFETGVLGDDAVYFDWYAAKRGLDVWERHYRILSGISV